MVESNQRLKLETHYWPALGCGGRTGARIPGHRASHAVCPGLWPVQLCLGLYCNLNSELAWSQEKCQALLIYLFNLIGWLHGCESVFLV